MRCITAPKISSPTEQSGPSLFLAGGISGCPNWQAEILLSLSSVELTVYNPRRTEFPIEKKAIQEQIEWEYIHLRKASAIAFWFPAETLCPITLYELGAHAMRDVPLFVGVHPEYARRLDIEIQLSLVRPEIQISQSIEELSTMITLWASQGS